MQHNIGIAKKTKPTNPKKPIKAEPVFDASLVLYMSASSVLMSTVNLLIASLLGVPFHSHSRFHYMVGLYQKPKYFSLIVFS